MAFEAQSHSHHSIAAAKLAPPKSDFLGHLTSSANQETDPPRARSDPPTAPPASQQQKQAGPDRSVDPPPVQGTPPASSHVALSDPVLSETHCLPAAPAVGLHVVRGP